MMAIILVGIVAFGISMLSLFSGFGLGTVLMPVFALFFPLPVAIAATAVVHLSNNIFKVFLVGRNADWSVIAKFSTPGVFAAIAGAYILTLFGSIPVLFSYSIGSRTCDISVMKLCIGSLILLFSVLELTPMFNRLQFPRKYLPLGGFISGFFGGLSGHQGAFRSAFLIKSGLSKDTFIATGVISAAIVDVARIAVYGISFYISHVKYLNGQTGKLVISAIILAFLGAWTGKNLIKKMTISHIQKLVAVLLIVLGIALGTGLI